MASLYPVFISLGFVIIQTPAWRTKSLCLFPSVTGWSSYISQEPGSPFYCFLRLAVLRSVYTIPPSHRECLIKHRDSFTIEPTLPSM
jgi:hypothetical protein